MQTRWLNSSMCKMWHSLTNIVACHNWFNCYWLLTFEYIWRKWVFIKETLVVLKNNWLSAIYVYYRVFLSIYLLLFHDLCLKFLAFSSSVWLQFFLFSGDLWVETLFKWNFFCQGIRKVSKIILVIMKYLFQGYWFTDTSRIAFARNSSLIQFSIEYTVYIYFLIYKLVDRYDLFTD